MKKSLLPTFAFALAFSFSLFSQNPYPATPADERMQAWEQHQQLLETSLVKSLPFRSVGPSVFSGRVADIDVSPTDPTHFYVAYASGGLWKTTNNGTSFTPLFDDQAVMTIGDIAVDWEHDIIWIGTGEVNSSRSSYAGNGMYRSGDCGKTWQHLGLEESHHIGRVILHPTDTNTLWVAALGHLYSPNEERGIYKTTDGGKTWRQVLYVNPNAGGIDLLVDPDDPNLLYAATWERTRRAWNFTEAGAGSGIWRSRDGGENWTRLNRPDSGFPTGENIGRIGLALYAEGDERRLYAIVDNYNRRPPEEQEAQEGLSKEEIRSMRPKDFLEMEDEKLAAFLKRNNFPEKYTVRMVKQMVKNGDIAPIALVEYLEDANSLLFDTPVYGAQVYRSEDLGESWNITHQEPLDGVFYSYGYYFGQIRVSPRDPDKIYIMGVPVLRSNDGGATFASINGPNVHADHHALWLSPQRPGHLIVGNDGGINISYDDGEHWVNCNTPPVGQFYTVTLDMAEPYNIYGGLQDNGVWVGPSTYRFSYRWYAGGQYPYKRIMGGDGMQVAVDSRDNNTVYTGYQFGNYFRLKREGGGRPDYITPKHELGERPLRWNWQTPIHLSTHNQDILYMGSHKVHRSMDQGNTFTAISGDLTRGGEKGDVPYGTLTTLHESPLQFGLLYAGSDDGLLHVTRNGGASWEKVSDPWPQHLWVSRVQASAHRKSRVYAALNGYRWDVFDAWLYVSDNYGLNWEPLGENLPQEPINVIREDPANPDILYLGTDHGAYVSLDRGQTFMPFAEGLPAVPVHDLAVHPRDKELVLATHGRSFYLADVEQLQQMDSAVLNSPLHLFAIDDIRHSSSWGSRSFDWSEYRQPELQIPFFVKEAGPVRVEISFSGKNEGDQLLLFEESIEAEAGLNFYPYQLHMKPEAVPELLSYLDQYGTVEREEPVQLERADDGNFYLPPERYELQINTKQGPAKASFTVK